MTSLKSIRTAFLDFFANREGNPHTLVPSAPLVPQNDPTLLFVNAGMVPFKNVFTGQETRPYTRATSSQKCVRAGGKHNDLDNVGYTARHHTFFEMLGNFSFGDYFKEDAIDAAWSLVTGEFCIPADRLLVTVYHTDDEAFDLWRKIAGLPEDRIIRIATHDNFWAMGDTGPCGPCSEIFYDHGPSISGGPPGSAEEDGDRFIEIWNLVFMQYERHGDGHQSELPRPSIDTGMGLERIAAVLQGVHDNYDIDLFRTLIEASVELTRRPSAVDEQSVAIAHRVISDHLRASCFLIGDGVSPSNEGRGYVLRRIMRRAMRYAHNLGMRDPLLAQLAPVLISEMGDAFPELRRAEPLIVQTLTSEEQKFAGLLDRGMKLLRSEMDGLGEGLPLPGDTAFKLYDTYGFPLDLTQDALRREGRGVDVAGFDAAMKAQKAAARAAWSGSGDTADETLWLDLRDKFGSTEFLGYVHAEADGKVVAIVENGINVDRADAGVNVEILCNQTPFYAEAGGQVGDTGTITSENGMVKVRDTRKRAGTLFSHIGEVKSGTLQVGDVVRLRIDDQRRDQIRANHSATHLVHAALRNVLGDHVTQKGSLVSGDRMRFDFSHPTAVTAAEIQRIEDEVNRIIRQNSEVGTTVMSYDDAVASGAMALFGEKYDDDVRVLTMGRQPDDPAKPYSVELCGGTHVRRLGDIALFKIVGESAVAAGIRRIDVMTGDVARRHLETQARLGKDAADILKIALPDLPQRVSTLVQERKKLEREFAEVKKALALSGATGKSGGVKDAANGADNNGTVHNGTAAGARIVNGVAYLAQVVDGIAPKDLRSLVDEAKAKLGSGVVAFVAVNEGKAALVVGVTPDLNDRVNAVDLARIAAERVGGKGGGGRPDMAQAGGPDGKNAADALEAIAASL